MLILKQVKEETLDKHIKQLGQNYYLEEEVELYYRCKNLQEIFS